MTATADTRTRLDIIEQFKLDATSETFLSGFDRPNIKYSIAAKNGPGNQLLQFIRDHHEGDAGIVYCMSRNKVETTAAFLVKNGFEAFPYHAGMEKDDRALNQDRFLREDGIIMVATVAFGMGIDKPNVRYVVHAGMPKSLENYQQESGRAGRDSLEAECVLIYSGQDFLTWQRIIEDGEAIPDGASESLKETWGYCTSSTQHARSSPDLLAKRVYTSAPFYGFPFLFNPWVRLGVTVWCSTLYHSIASPLIS